MSLMDGPGLPFPRHLTSLSSFPASDTGSKSQPDMTGKRAMGNQLRLSLVPGSPRKGSMLELSTETCLAVIKCTPWLHLARICL